MAKPDTTRRSIATNRRARHQYHVLETLECGLVLQGSEVKSLRAGHASIGEAYARIKNGELFLIGAHIPEYKHGSAFNHEPLRERKLLAHRREIEKIHKKLKEKGFTLVPLELYFQGARVKLEIGLVKGKKLYDKRQTQRDRDDKRAMDRAQHRRR